MKKFEYETLSVDAKGFLGGKVDKDALKQVLNDKGRDGWELVNVVASNQGYGNTRWIICFLKREIL